MIAHQGGWDEIWLPLGLIVLAVAYALRRRGKHEPDGSPPPYCLYCGRELPPEAERCEACGFRRKGTNA